MSDCSIFCYWCYKEMSEEEIEREETFCSKCRQEIEENKLISWKLHILENSRKRESSD